ncbi:5'-methylthioadenosine/adenosylhomocysteine nucleosidase [Thermicanus aegyptius]|uniref:5'-methylthioadenosine/adenosylhomocysteine nucleosidase n=1 Tax=Thermicanus aegyptius TaxID=94009 RepID=UPI000422669B|nr:5'-methylthioadenosine/adenosylhomocysteine nucleosidase [Thermicanus aegyptius]
MEPVGIIGAMEEEIERFLPHLTEEESHVIAGIRYISGKMNGKPIVLVKSGVGKVNAAVCTQILIDRFSVSSILFTGVAGALHPELEIGDIVISTDAMQHDMDASPLGFPRGVIPFFPESIFPADQRLVDMAAAAAEAIGEGKVMRGRVLSGDQFFANHDKVKELHERFHGVCTEMEGAAVAQVAYMNRIPYVIIRSMSDKADGSSHIDFQAFTRLAAERSYKVIVKMLENL